MNAFADLRYAFRLLLKTPGFTLISIFVMALGLGLCINIYGTISTVAFKTLDVPNADRLVAVHSVEGAIESGGSSIRIHDLLYFRDRQTSLEALAAFSSSSVNVSTGESSQRVAASMVLAELFALAPVEPLLGRLLITDDNHPDAAPVVLLGHDLWTQHYNAQSDIIGQQARIDGEWHTIVGVLPKGYEFPMYQDLWLPMKLPVNPRPGELNGLVTLVGHLKQGVTLDDAHKEFRDLARQLEIDHPATHTNRSTKVWPFTQAQMSNSMGIIRIMFAAGVFILLLACINMGSLMVARGSERTKELAVRRALGAPRSRLVRLVMMETLIICAFAAIVGVPAAGLGLEYADLALTQIGSGQIPFWWHFELDAELLFAALALTTATALATGLWPAMKASGVDCVAVLREGTRSGQGRTMSRLIRTLVVIEIFLAVSLLTIAGTMIVTGAQAVSADYGVATDGFVTVRITPSESEYPEVSHRYYESLISELTKEPNIKEAAVSTALPGSYATPVPMAREGINDQQQGQYPTVYAVVVSHGFFGLLDHPVIAGRDFDAADTADNLPVAIVSQAFAKTHWKDENPVGKRMKLRPANDTPWLTIIGVVPSIVQGQPIAAVASMNAVYLPMNQRDSNAMLVLAKGVGSIADQIESIRQAAARIDPHTPIYDGKTLNARLSEGVAGLRFMSNQFLAFALVTIILASIGIYGVMARSSALRSHEIGVRRALGATNGAIIKMLLFQGAGLVVAGAAFGIIVSYLGMGQLSLLQVVGHESPLLYVMAGVLVLVSAVVGLATVLPARRAVALQPNVALRYE